MKPSEFKRLLKKSYDEGRPSKLFIILMILLFAVFAFYPSDTVFFAKRIRDNGVLVYSIDHYVRFVNTAAQVAIPIILRDKVGMMQAAYVGIATVVSTQTLKRVFDHFSISGTKLGQRPTGKKRNMPSGHSSMVSCAMYFVCKRYGKRHALYLIPVMVLTMYARIMIKAHTFSAVLAGCILGILMAALFTSKYKKEGHKPNMKT